LICSIDPSDAFKGADLVGADAMVLLVGDASTTSRFRIIEYKDGGKNVVVSRRKHL
jgi:hypothetical protein